MRQHLDRTCLDHFLVIWVGPSSCTNRHISNRSCLPSLLLVRQRLLLNFARWPLHELLICTGVLDNRGLLLRGSCCKVYLIDIQMGRASRMLSVHLTGVLDCAVLEWDCIICDRVGTNLSRALYWTNRPGLLLQALSWLYSRHWRVHRVWDGLSQVVLHHEERCQLELWWRLPYFANYIALIACSTLNSHCLPFHSKLLAGSKTALLLAFLFSNHPCPRFNSFDH